MKLKHHYLNSFISYLDVDRPIDWKKQFSNQGPVDVEIGFGNGEFLTRSAQANPGRNLVGIDQHWDSVQKTLKKIYTDRLDNVRVLLVDARIAFERLFCLKSIENIYTLFLCPWPKKCHIKHRLFSQKFLKLLNSRLIDGGQLKIVTDFLPYHQWLTDQVQGTGFRIETKTVEPKYNTKYERKWIEGGQKEFFEFLLFKEQHIEVPLKEDMEVKPYFVEEFSPDNFQMNDVKGEVTVIFKDFLYDAQRKKAMIHLVVAEENLTQHFWVTIVYVPGGWHILPANGHKFIPSKGIGVALKLIRDICIIAAKPVNS